MLLHTRAGACCVGHNSVMARCIRAGLGHSSTAAALMRVHTSAATAASAPMAAALSTRELVDDLDALLSPRLLMRAGDDVLLRRGAPGREQRAPAFTGRSPQPSQTPAAATSEPSGRADELESTPLDSFADLSPGLKSRLRDAGISALFPVQRETVERVFRGEDIVVRSRTGSGKTLGFAIPVVELLLSKFSNAAVGVGSSSDRPSPRCIVLTPTRELAKQVEGEFKRIAYRGLRSLAVYGGAAFGPQADDLRRGVDIVVGTPGRIMDHLERGTLDLRRCKFAILDEADEMLRMGFKEDVETIYKSLPPKTERQNMLWSATVPPWVRSLAREYCNAPSFVDLVGEDASKLPSTASFQVVLCEDGAARDSVFGAVIGRAARVGSGRVLVFADTKARARSLSQLDVPGVRMAELTGDLSQGIRERTLDDFRAGRLAVICATDVAARGLDIPSVDVVLQLGLPFSTETFVHRSGRTARAGNVGTVILLVSRGQLREVAALERELSISFAIVGAPSVAAPDGGCGAAGALALERGSGGKHSSGSVGGSGAGAGWGIDAATRRKLLQKVGSIPASVAASATGAVAAGLLLPQQTLGAPPHPSLDLYAALVARCGGSAETALRKALVVLAHGDSGGMTPFSLLSGARDIVTARVTLSYNSSTAVSAADADALRHLVRDSPAEEQIARLAAAVGSRGGGGGVGGRQGWRSSAETALEAVLDALHVPDTARPLLEACHFAVEALATTAAPPAGVEEGDTSPGSDMFTVAAYLDLPLAAFEAVVAEADASAAAAAASSSAASPARGGARGLSGAAAAAAAVLPVVRAVTELPPSVKASLFASGGGSHFGRARSGSDHGRGGRGGGGGGGFRSYGGGGRGGGGGGGGRGGRDRDRPSSSSFSSSSGGGGGGGEERRSRSYSYENNGGGGGEDRGGGGGGGARFGQSSEGRFYRGGGGGGGGGDRGHSSSGPRRDGSAVGGRPSRRTY